MSDFFNRVNIQKEPKKRNSINLKKGQRINLKKDDNTQLSSFCVGANWGVIKKTGFLGRVKIEPVDLDLSAMIFDDYDKLVDLVYFGNLRSLGVVHYGDDLTGDTDGDDGLDNEVIYINLEQFSVDIKQVVFVLNSYNHQDFSIIPFASIRLYERTADKVNKVFATYNIANDSKYAGHVSMVLGKLYKKNRQWKFKAIGEPTRDSELKDTVETVCLNYL